VPATMFSAASWLLVFKSTNLSVATLVI